MEGEYDYQPSFWGNIPQGLEGTLYRNGPGLFERNGRRKCCLLDGDGMVQAFKFANGQVQYSNRFVKTSKYIEESQAGEFLYPTWTTQAPGGFWRNLVAGKYPNQAGITVIHRNGKLFAFDEYKMPYELDPKTLETYGESDLGIGKIDTVISAHSKIDPKSREWLFFGLQYGQEVTLHLTTLDSTGRVKNHQKATLPTYTYMHDFFITEKYILMNLHPVELDLINLLTSRQSMAGSLRWREGQGNKVLVFDRLGNGDYQMLEASSSWMWHTLNAFDLGPSQICADFIGYDFPDHFLGQDPALFAIMEGRIGNFKNPGKLRRYTIDLNTSQLSEDIIDNGNLEFPFIDPNSLGRPYRYGYYAEIRRDDLFYNSVTKIDLISGHKEFFDFGPSRYCSEPVFISAPKGKNQDQGWLLVQGHDGETKKSFLAILDCHKLNDGPIAMIFLEHHVPLSFHGYWSEHRSA